MQEFIRRNANIEERLDNIQFRISGLTEYLIGPPPVDKLSPSPNASPPEPSGELYRVESGQRSINRRLETIQDLLTRLENAIGPQPVATPSTMILSGEQHKMYDTFTKAHF